MTDKAADQFIDKFEMYLQQLDKSERDDVVEFYREYLIDGKLDTADKINKKLGTPKHLARKILADYSIKMSEQNYQNDGYGFLTDNQKMKKNMIMIGLIILALLATPVAMPIAIGLIGVVLFFIVAAIFFTLLVLFLVALSIVGAIALIGVGFGVVFQSFLTSIFYIGVGLAVLGVDFIIVPLIVSFCKWLFDVLVVFFRWVGKKLLNGRNAPKKEGQDNA
ncbi:DUF1700 domain-containing protein [Companilactobacillus versmoldensis]|uniref:Integral membrane protein n=1 Tax=Companilactobacillus versmoldensis DSM 14857 = KCTC 3814 TaxID=1423815 RepID=A0A0R1SA40_9LACO|nr:DUF1700 domain-containing protein [Companilactobacillus versmoldensis]KRL66029.1 hypothetical protein FC27_GL001102 [Companilactobacillus versmoldensis DSM 14857 = KCTC 3814]